MKVRVSFFKNQQNRKRAKILTNNQELGKFCIIFDKGTHIRTTCAGMKSLHPSRHLPAQS